jgi:NTP pyrophosphatase (non-canonical NTP hydrolase)
MLRAMPDSLDDLTRRVDAFAAARDWHRFHSPKNLASALIVEAGELLEHFQWLTEAQSQSLDDARKAEVADEMADVLLYLVQMSNVMKVDLIAAAQRKIERNETRFPPLST